MKSINISKDYIDKRYRKIYRIMKKIINKNKTKDKNRISKFVLKRLPLY